MNGIKHSYLLCRMGEEEGRREGDVWGGVSARGEVTYNDLPDFLF